VVQRKKDYEERYAAAGRIVKPIGEKTELSTTERGSTVLHD
jgi:hypothetical protein